MDIDLYSKSTDKYEELQNKRPDYVGAINEVAEVSTSFLSGSKDVTITDFCSGVGNITKKIANNIGGIFEANLIDINKAFLDIASNSGIKTDNLNLINSDAIVADITTQTDLVLSVFAYHHIPDNKKLDYVRQLKKAVKPNGILVLAEIYSPDKSTTLAYYEHLLTCIPESDRSVELQKFINETAQSDDFEFKVSMDFAHKQFEDCGFALKKSTKIFPLDSTFDEKVGTFVEVWSLEV